MGQPLNGREAVSVGYSGDERSVSVTGVGVPNVLLTAVGELERGDVLGSRYQIEAVIGTGGSGRVLRAFDRESRMPVALKILRPDFASDPVWTERFSRELRIGRTITHPNVCRVFDIGDADGHKFLSMELASRGSIRADVPKLGAARVTPTRPLRSWGERVADAQAVVEGVAALHAAGIVHRDLKPENILRMEDGHLVVTDFGLATDPDAHGNTVMVGTPSYMAPEVVMGDPATKRSDVWGLGVVLHEILFGCRPQWKPAGRGYRKFVLPDEVTTAVQRATAELCGRCADDTADVRPASAAEVRDELVRALKGKRRLSRARTRQIAWGVMAVAAFGALAVVRERWSNRAEASSSGAAAPTTDRVLTPTGTPQDWSTRATKLASFSGRVHCLSFRHDKKKAQLIWGEPRRAEEIDIQTGQRSAWSIPRQMFESGCPQVSSDGRSVLFEKTVGGSQEIFLSKGRDVVRLVRGTAPRWLPNDQEFVFKLDDRHAATFSVATRRMLIVGDDVGNEFGIDEAVTDESGGLLAILYSTASFGELVVHRLPGLELVDRVRVPTWGRSLTFDASGKVQFTLITADGYRRLVALDLKTHVLSNVAYFPSRDIRETLAVGSRSLAISRTLQFNLGSVSRKGEVVPLTKDGQSVHGSLSQTGQLLIQRGISGGREAIVLRNVDGTERQLTEGPRDVTPAFFPDGEKWVFTRLGTGELVECSLSKETCSVVHKDPLIPSFGTPSPSGREIAYVTAMNGSRVRVLSRDSGAIRDLGPTEPCAPIWQDEQHLWIRISDGGNDTSWTEVESATGRRTGQLRSGRVMGGQANCPFPDGLDTIGARRGVSIATETADLSYM